MNDIARAFHLGFEAGLRGTADDLVRIWTCPCCHTEMRRMLRGYHLQLEWRTRSWARGTREQLIREIENL